jgi:type II secretory pathway pseudopilin PulG
MTTRITINRSGITLTEILISIMIMGIGLVSLATLFPLGLIRIRDAQRYSRSTYLAETAASDAGTRNLFDQSTFVNSWYSNFQTFTGFSPFRADPPPGFLSSSVGITVLPANTVQRTAGPGLPVALDPLWWSVVHQFSSQVGQGPVLTPITADVLAPFSAANGNVVTRFGSGIGFVRPDPNPGNGTSIPSAHGLQRATNFIATIQMLGPYQGWQFVYYIPNTLPFSTLDVAGEMFTSPDDIVMQDGQGAQIDKFSGLGSPVVPTMYDPITQAFGALRDWSYSWMFTGQVTDVDDGTMFTGNIVVFQNRPLGVETVTTPFNGQMVVPQGERVVEAIYGGLGGGNRTVLLRWPTSMPDPDVKVGHWIADVTYERFGGVGGNESIRFPYTIPPIKPTPAQRCYWYQVARRSPVTASFADESGIAHNQMVVTVTTALEARTQMNFTVSPPLPLHVNAALLIPSVVNVFPRTIYVR